MADATRNPVAELKKADDDVPTMKGLTDYVKSLSPEEYASLQKQYEEASKKLSLLPPEVLAAKKRKLLARAHADEKKESRLWEAKRGTETKAYSHKCDDKTYYVLAHSFLKGVSGTVTCTNLELVSLSEAAASSSTELKPSDVDNVIEITFQAVDQDTWPQSVKDSYEALPDSLDDDWLECNDTDLVDRFELGLHDLEDFKIFVPWNAEDFHHLDRKCGICRIIPTEDWYPTDHEDTVCDLCRRKWAYDSDLHGYILKT